MAEAFDPYYKWLGIPPEEQPPNHYRLLGVAEFEADADVIDAASEQRMIFLQAVANGPHTEASQKLLNVVAAARLCLLDPRRKADYDAQLRAGRASQPATAPTGPPPLPGEAPLPEFIGLEPPAVATSAGRRPTRHGRNSTQLMWVGGGAATALVIAIIVFAVLWVTRKPPRPKVLIQWPLSQREGAELLINDKRHSLGEDPLVEVELSPGTYRIEMRRKGFRSIIKRDVVLDKESVRRYKLVWERESD